MTSASIHSMSPPKKQPSLSIMVRPLLLPMLAEETTATSFWKLKKVMLDPLLIAADFDTMSIMPSTPRQRPIALLGADSRKLPGAMLKVFWTIEKPLLQTTFTSPHVV